MADLMAIGYKDEATAEAAADEARRRARDLTIEPDAIAVIVRDTEGKFHVHTSHHSVEDGTTWGMLWGLLFGVLFFVPFLGVAIGAGLGAIMGRITKAGIDNDFQDQVRDMLQPGTSALFLLADKAPRTRSSMRSASTAAPSSSPLSARKASRSSRTPCTAAADRPERASRARPPGARGRAAGPIPRRGSPGTGPVRRLPLPGRHLPPVHGQRTDHEHPRGDDDSPPGTGGNEREVNDGADRGEDHAGHPAPDHVT